MLLSQEIIIDKEDRQRDIFMKFIDEGPILLHQTLHGIMNESIQSVEQNDSDVSYCGKISKSDGELNFSKQSIEHIHNLFRAYDPWPGIFSFYK
jgi:methionyl-tRNA formyltransferase